MPLALFVYVSGFLGLSFHAGRLGIPTGSLVEPQCIATGIWILAPLLVGSAMLHAGAATVKDEPLEPVANVGFLRPRLGVREPQYGLAPGRTAPLGSTAPASPTR